MADGFLGRWSQRKQALREGRTLEEPPLPKATLPAASATGATGATDAPALPTPSAADPAPKAAPPPTLEDVKALTADSSYAPFVSRDVAPDVRNAAMKKLFTDPHYNVMDGLDIYIDDYSVPSPMPAAMLRQLASAKFLNLFDEDPPPAPAEAPQAQATREDANTAPEASVAKFAPAQESPDTPATLPLDVLPASTFDAAPLHKDTPHDHTDLRLQPDHAARPEGPERFSE